MKTKSSFKLIASLFAWAVLTMAPAQGFYSPEHGRWINRDPISEPGFGRARGQVPHAKTDRFDYVAMANRPLGVIDPQGLQARSNGDCPCGLRVSMMLALGPVDGIRAFALAMEALDLVNTLRLPGPINGQGDAFRHCFWSCRMMQEFIPVGTATDTYEKCGKDTPAESAMDHRNNEIGRTIGAPGVDCQARCLEALRDGRLQTAP